MLLNLATTTPYNQWRVRANVESNESILLKGLSKYKVRTLKMLIIFDVNDLYTEEDVVFKIFIVLPKARHVVEPFCGVTPGVSCWHVKLEVVHLKIAAVSIYDSNR